MDKIIFVISILIWCFIGFLGGLRSRETCRVSYEMIIFIALAPFIPVLAMICGLK